MFLGNPSQEQNSGKKLLLKEDVFSPIKEVKLRT